MPHTLPSPSPDGSFKHFLPNSVGRSGAVGIDAGLSAKVKLWSAGSGIQLVAADGVTVLLDVPETGFVPPVAPTTFVALVPQAVAPAGLAEGGIWYSSVDHQYHGLNDQGDCILG